MFRLTDICDGIAKERKGKCKGKYKGNLTSEVSRHWTQPVVGD
jgi:hypothetical protein